MKVVMAGSSGFLGAALRDRLAREGHEVTRLVRGEAVSASESHWDPYAHQVDRGVIESADAVVNLAGSPLAGLIWTDGYKKKLLDSRVETTRTLAEAIAAADRKPAFIAQNGTAGYGNRGSESLTEDASMRWDESMMSRVTKAWEDATKPAAEAGARVCVMRSGVILDKSGGIFKPLSLLFKAGLGGRAGSGEQYFATISLTDWTRAAAYLISTPDCAGPYNLVAPDPPTNAELTAELGRALHRPTRLNMPEALLRRAMGAQSSELLGSIRVQPGRLLEAGFEFEHPTLQAQLANALS